MVCRRRNVVPMSMKIMTGETHKAMDIMTGMSPTSLIGMVLPGMTIKTAIMMITGATIIGMITVMTILMVMMTATMMIVTMMTTAMTITATVTGLCPTHLPVHHLKNQGLQPLCKRVLYLNMCVCVRKASLYTFPFIKHLISIFLHVCHFFFLNLKCQPYHCFNFLFPFEDKTIIPGRLSCHLCMANNTFCNLRNENCSKIQHLKCSERKKVKEHSLDIISVILRDVHLKSVCLTFFDMSSTHTFSLILK